MTNKSEYDVFLCHNSKEKKEVERLRELLRERGISAWLDQYDFEPFRPWQEQLEEIISQIKSAAVFIGSSGVGPWADIEMKEFIVEFAQRNLRMGLVILPGCPEDLIQSVPRFMKKFHRVDFRQQDPDPMEQLIWGITGQKPRLISKRKNSITKKGAEIKLEKNNEIVEEIQAEELRVKDIRDNIVQVSAQIQAREKFSNPQLEEILDWLSDQKRSRLAERVGKEVLKDFPHLEEELNEDSDNIIYFYEDIENYLKLIYYSLIIGGLNLLREPCVEPFLSDAEVYAAALELVKIKIPKEVPDLVKAELKSRLDYLKERILS